MWRQLTIQFPVRVAAVVTGVLTLFGSSCAEQTEPAEKSGGQQDEYAQLTRKSCEYLVAQQAHCEARYHLGEYDKWYYDENTGHLTFSDPVLPELVIEYEKVGSVALKSNTWLWAWNNQHTYPKVRSQIGRVRTFGTRQGNGFERLTEPVLWNATQADGWEMTSIAAYLLKAKGAYRVPVNRDSLFSFMIFKSIQVVPKAK